MRTLLPTIVALLLVVGSLTVSQEQPTQLDQIIAAGGSNFARDLGQDSDQALCSLHSNRLPASEIGGFLERQRASIRYPDNRKLLGNWRDGERLFIDVRKGNCYACHTADPREKSAGRMGPSLTAYGQRGTAEATIVYTYEKIFNAWAFQPCSLMYRGGYHGLLSPNETAHITAYLLDPASPVNGGR